MAERYQCSNGQDNNSSAASDSGTSTDWDGRWECKNVQLAEEKVTTQETAELNGTTNFGAPGAIETITATTLAD